MPNPPQLQQAPLASNSMFGGNPLEMMNSLTDWQLKLNQNRMFQTQFMANQALGEIMAHSGSIEEGMQNLSQNPLVMGYATEGVKNVAALQNIMRQTGLTEMGMIKTGYDAALNAGIQIRQSPEQALKIYQGIYQMLDPSVRQRAMPFLQAVSEPILRTIGQYDLSTPDGYANAQKALDPIIAGQFAASGGNVSQLEPFIPKPQLTPQGFMFRPPAQVPTGPGGVGGPGIIPTGQGQGPGAGPQGAAQGPGQAPLAGATNPLTGKPYPAPTPPPFAAGGQPNVMGVPVLANPALQQGEEDAVKDFNGPEKTNYQASQTLRSQAIQLLSAANDLNTTKAGWLHTGPLAPVISQFAALKEQIQTMTGQKLDVELPAANSRIALINKTTNQMAFAYDNAMMGTGRHAFGTLLQSLQGVPGLQNTPLAFNLLASSIKAMADYGIANYEYKNARLHDPRTGYTLTGSDVDFNRAAPPEAFIMQEMGKFGFKFDPSDPTKLSFQSKEAFQRALNSGMLGNPDDPNDRKVIEKAWNDTKKGLTSGQPAPGTPGVQ